MTCDPARRWLLLLGHLLCGAAAVAVPSLARAQDGTPCTTQYILENDDAYWTETKYTISESCRRRLMEELRSKRSASYDKSYVMARLNPNENEAAVALEWLCWAGSYARACSAMAQMVLDGRLRMEHEALLRLFEAAANGGVPVAQVLLGDLKLDQYRKSLEQSDLCAAMRLWRRAASNRDPVGKRRVDGAIASFGAQCDES